MDSRVSPKASDGNRGSKLFIKACLDCKKLRKRVNIDGFAILLTNQ